jgi:alanine racemase
VRHNVARLRSGLPQGTRILAVVKAQGYGHGAEPVARASLDAGAWGLAVSTLAEADQLKALVRPGRLLVMGGLAPSEARAAVELGCAVGCYSFELARALSDAADRRSPLPVHMKIDTGMGRFGCAPEIAPELARYIVAAPGLHLEGTWTHFHSADSDERATRRQFELFSQTLDSLGVEPGLRHAANSAAALRYPEMALDAVRCGIALYGCEHPELRPALTLRALVTHVKDVPPGASAGYGATWRAQQPSRLATVSIGYADGVMRARSNRGWVLIRGSRAPIAGAVSMDSLTVDVTEIDGVSTGDVATLIGSDGEERIRAEQVAEWSGTISYEVLTAIGARVERRHLE